MRNLWSDKEVKILKEFYPSLGIELLKNKLNRSSASIRGKAHGLGIKSNHRIGLSPKNKKYNLSLEQLKEQYIKQELPLYKIADNLNVSKKTLKKELLKANITIRNVKESQEIRNRKTSRIKKKDFYNAKGGYILIRILRSDPYFPMCEAKYKSVGYIREHRYVMAKHIRRCLLKTECVHHKNGIKTDNRLENLELLSPSQHGQHERYCDNCDLKKEIRLLKWQIKQLTEQLQYRMDVPNEL